MIDYQINKTPKVSVIMNCLNCSQYLKEAIDSVYAQTYKNWEIIFWDNASTDDSMSITQGYDNRLRYFRGEETVPLYAARNLALQQATGDIIAFLDCDDKWLPLKLEKQLPLFNIEKVGLVFSNTIFYNQRTKKERILYKNKPLTGMVFEHLLSSYFLSLETVMIRKKCLYGLSEWFDARFNNTGDSDLFTRISHDWEIAYVDEPLAVWRMHDKSLTWVKHEFFSKERKMMLEKYELLYENFNSKYDRPIKSVNAIIAYYEALEQWKNNHTIEVRKIILPHIKNRPKLLIVYLLSILSFEQYTGLLRIIGKHP